METMWDVSAVIAVGVLAAAVVVRHVMRMFAPAGSAACGGGCCGKGAKRPDDSGGCR
ncbi:MAG: hypothetical protein HQL38_10050 [Alphaproteobacteria bacterium]|nr:hypothetical protein [Alphaproteobacteria bacterium]MBF0336056.1 hypothetical protein [Alphaproteobacteria bacterium]MBF0374490.1 hypothetical protein [Alphaproteobacteria bacterium]MBF0393013.1 hypothetical protein [Alphaproteobacteria bacterium]